MPELDDSSDGSACDLKRAYDEIDGMEADLVPHGLGAPCGLSEEEHIEWAIKQQHQISMEQMCVDDDLRQATEFELSHSLDESCPCLVPLSLLDEA